MNRRKLRDKFATNFNAGIKNEYVTDWMLETPKDVRTGGLRDLVKGFSTNIKMFKQGKIPRFEMRYRTRKKDTSMEIAKSSIKIVGKKLIMYSTYLSPIKLARDKYLRKDIKIEYDCRLKREGKKWYILIPYKKQVSEHVPSGEVCSLDPGIRKFQTIFSEKETVKFEINKEYLLKLHNKIDLLRSLRDKKIIPKRSGKHKLWNVLENHVTDMHNKVITFLTNNYKTILIPIFESQKLGRSMRGKGCKRSLFTFSHFKFRMKLLDKAKISLYNQVIICTEEFTSKTCTNCGKLNDELGFSEVFTCPTCGLVIDRDENGARNVLIKYLTEILPSR